MDETRLPKSLKDLKSCFRVNSDADVRSLISEPGRMTKSQSLIWKYTGGALQSGRPLDSTIIMMAGASGAGKSTTINNLFNDNTLCNTNDSESETDKIVLIQKSLEISMETPTLLTTLNFVDCPGIFDTNSKNEQANLNAIRRFKSSRIELKDRTTIPWLFRKYYSIPKNVYPNLVLFVVSASDNRMDGPNSFLRKSLEVFKSTENVIDPEKNNLIVVLTHVMNLSPSGNMKTFVERLEKTKEIIRRAVKEKMGIPNVKIVPIENQPEEYSLSKSGDFYKLPNGDFSHFNLFETMQNCLKKNKDNLGRISIAWYSKPNCPDRNKRAEVIEDPHLQVSEQDDDWEDSGTEYGEMALEEHEQPCQVLNMECIGCGFCPVNERIKAIPPLNYNSSELKTIEIGKSKFYLPDGMTVIPTQTVKYHGLGFYKKQDYEIHMKNLYGFDIGLGLIVSGNSKGKWIKDGVSSGKHVRISVVHEIKVATLRLQNPDEHLKSERFQNALDNLPENYCEDTESQFSSFLSMWGTHLIYELGLGGSIQLNCKLKEASVTGEKLTEIETNISGIFNGLFSANPEYTFKENIKKLRSIGVVEEYLEIVGGNPPFPVNLENINPQILQSWAESVAVKPSELLQTIKLYPYYSFLEGEKEESLKQATENYLRNKAKERIETEMKQNMIADETIEEVKAIKPQKGQCFPIGARVLLHNGSMELIENLDKINKQTQKLAAVKLSGFVQKMKICGLNKTRFCTYLDVKSEEMTEYLCLMFSNGKKLLVSGGHVIFQYLPEEKRVFGKQAKYFKIGDRMVYTHSGEATSVVEYPVLVEISREYHVGAYCTLTSSGTLFVDGFFVSSYTKTDFFSLGQFALAPLKLHSMMSNNKKTEGVGWQYRGGIHPYARFLISLRKCYRYVAVYLDKKLVSGCYFC